MLELTDYLIILLLGSLGGFISGFLGVGGGIVYIPILDYFLQKMGMHDEALVKGILANSLFTIIFSGSIASYKQYKLGNFYLKEILNTALPGVLTALLVTWLIKSGTWYSKELFNYVFACMLLIIAVRMFTAKAKVSGDSAEAAPGKYRLTGIFAGMITAFSGLGGGVVMTPVFTDLLKQNIKKASSISNGVIPFFAIAIGIYNLSSPVEVRVHEWQMGHIVFPVVLPMIISAVAFAPIGVNTSQRTDPAIIRIVFAIFVSLTFFKTIYAIFF